MTLRELTTLYFSPTGTSRRIAEAVADGIRHTNDIGYQCRDITFEAAPQREFPSDALLVAAVPVYGGHPAPLALERMKELRGHNTPAVIVVVYGNRAFDHAATELADLLARQGFRTVAAGAFVGEHSYSTPATPVAAGRPDDRDLAEARLFGENIGAKLAGKGPEPVNVARLRTPRTPLLPLLRFIVFALGYLSRQKRHPVVLLPRTDAARCIHCGRCATGCPTGAITAGREELTDAARCIRCCACVKSCPVGARSFETPFAAALAHSFREPKPNVTLL